VNEQQIVFGLVALAMFGAVGLAIWSRYRA
jgi:hypothetical protein